MRFRWVMAIGVSVLGQMVGCGGDGGCPPVHLPSIYISLFDDVTGNRVGCGATIEVFEGQDLVETVNVPSQCHQDSLTTALVYEREGDYVVVVSLEGYEEWRSELISISHDGCNVIPENVSAWLHSDS